MWSKIDAYIKKYKLLNTSDLYLVALSGGADSVALLLLLKEHGFNVHAAHCNFHLRGVESDRDEAFCVELCQELGVELHRAHFDTHENNGWQFCFSPSSISQCFCRLFRRVNAALC